MTREELVHSAIAELQYQNEIDELYHHGILGMKWGVRRYQNEDGTLTDAGKKRYSMDIDAKDTRKTKKMKKDYQELSDKDFQRKYWTTKEKYKSKVEKYGDPIKHKRKVKNLVWAIGATTLGAAAFATTYKAAKEVFTENPEKKAEWFATADAIKAAIKNRKNINAFDYDRYYRKSYKKYDPNHKRYVRTTGYTKPDITGYLPGR